MDLAATTGLSIGILKDGKIHFYGYGETAKGSKQLPDEHTLFEIGSISKTFTAILLADAVNNGMIKLDDPVNKWLPDSIPRYNMRRRSGYHKNVVQSFFRHSTDACQLRYLFR